MSHHTGGTTELHALIEAQPLRGYHFVVFGLCVFALMLDGFDAQTMGYVAPALKAQLHLAPADLGRIFSASLAGMLIGAISLGMLADRFGRRPVLVGALMWCGVLISLTATVHTVPWLLTLRLLTGIGLGTLMPTLLALTSEYCPTRSRATVVMFVSTGFIIGATIGGLIAAALIPRFGPAAVFLCGGLASMVCALVLWSWLPESLQFLARSDAPPVEKIGRILSRFGLSGSHANALANRGPQTRQDKALSHWSTLFRGNLRTVTFLLWLVNFANLLDLYFLSNWLPTLLKSDGLPLAIAIAGSTALQSGGLPGSILLGVLARRFRIERVLLGNFLVGSVAIASIGATVHMGKPFLFTAIFVAGLCVVGGQSAINALCAHCYTPAIRSTGMGWASGVGRLGSVAGPLIGGLMVAVHWGAQDIMMGAAISGLAATSAVFALGQGTRIERSRNPVVSAEVR